MNVLSRSLCGLAVALLIAQPVRANTNLTGDWQGTADTSSGTPDKLSLKIDDGQKVHVVRTAPDGSTGSPYDAKIKPWGSGSRDYFSNPQGTTVYVFDRQGDALEGYWAYGAGKVQHAFHVTLVKTQ